MEKENRMNDKAALFLLYQAVDENGFEKISNSKTAKEAWDKLEKAYRSGDRVKQIKLQNLRGELEIAQMKANEDASDYIDRIQSIMSQLKKNGNDIPQNRVIEKVLRSLSEEYENVVCAIEESKDLSVLTVEELVGSLTTFEQRRKKKQQILEEALQVKANLNEKKEEKPGNWESRGGRGESSGGRSFGRNFQGRGRGQGGQRQKPDVDCYNCRKHGHYARDCWVEKKVKEKSNLTEEKIEKDGDMILMAQSASQVVLGFHV